MIVPISADLQKAYRDTLDIPSAPMFIDTDLPVTPVAVIAQAVNPQTATYSYITDGVDTAQVTTEGELSVSSSGLKLTMATGTCTAAGTTTIGTVPGGKVWRIYSATLGIYNSSTGETSAKVQFNGTTVLLYHVEQLTGVGVSVCPCVTTNFGGNYIQLTAGQTVTLVNAETGSWDSEATIFYIEGTA